MESWPLSGHLSGLAHSSVVELQVDRSDSTTVDNARPELTHPSYPSADINFEETAPAPEYHPEHEERQDAQQPAQPDPKHLLPSEEGRVITDVARIQEILEAELTDRSIHLIPMRRNDGRVNLFLTAQKTGVPFHSDLDPEAAPFIHDMAPSPLPSDQGTVDTTIDQSSTSDLAALPEDSTSSRQIDQDFLPEGSTGSHQNDQNFLPGRRNSNRGRGRGRGRGGRGGGRDHIAKSAKGTTKASRTKIPTSRISKPSQKDVLVKAKKPRAPYGSRKAAKEARAIAKAATNTPQPSQVEQEVSIMPPTMIHPDATLETPRLETNDAGNGASGKGAAAAANTKAFRIPQRSGRARRVNAGGRAGDTGANNDIGTQLSAAVVVESESESE